MSGPKKRSDSLALVRLALLNAIEHHEMAKGAYRKWQFLVLLQELFDMEFGEAAIDWPAVDRAFKISGDPV